MHNQNLKSTKLAPLGVFSKIDDLCGTGYTFLPAKYENLKSLYLRQYTRYNYHQSVCNELPAVRRVDGVCVYVRRKTKHDLTVRDRLTCISNALSLVVEVTVREEE